MSVFADSEETIALAEVFQDGQYRLVDEPDGWMGFERDENGYWFVDTRDGAPAWLQRTRVGVGAVREAITRHVTDSGGEDRR